MFYSILASLDRAFINILEMEGIDLGLMLRIGILRSEESEFGYFHAENKENIRLNLERSYFILLSSACRKNHCYINEYSAELIMGMFLHIILHE